MEHTEFARLAPALRRKAKAVGRDFFKEEEAAEDVAQETVSGGERLQGTDRHLHEVCKRRADRRTQDILGPQY